MITGVDSLEKYMSAFLFFIMPFSFYLIVVNGDGELFVQSFIFMNVALLVICIYSIASLHKNHLRYPIVPAIVLSGALPAFLADAITADNSGFISFGDYFFFAMILMLMIAPIFFITGIICLCLFISSKLRKK